TAKEGIIDVLDVSDPHGRLRTGTRIRVAGAILSRWQLDEHDGILRVVSQKGAGRTGNGIGVPEIDTFRVESAQSVTPLGHLNMSLPRQEGLRTVRFDGTRAYAITYNQTDPLFAIDLGDPSHPEQRGELHIPGFMFHLEPHGDRVIGLGIDRNDARGSLNVSLFDVSDPDEPVMLERVAFATPRLGEDYQILNGEISEDQDRIQKSFRVLPGGLVVVPFTALSPYGAQSSRCDNAGGGVQLVEWSSDTLRKRALLPLPGNPRRAFEHDSQLIAVSESNVRAFSLADLDVAHQTADLSIGTCTSSEPPYPSSGGFVRDDYSYACSISAAHGGGQSGPWLLGLLALVLLRLQRRCRS
ncbi:MAG TPA: beta-propeller domain-containing protein, partial [Polyangiales bacterium]|nr:beta-propeller domain-containing protein [Polyangiales bacterium]